MMKAILTLSVAVLLSGMAIASDAQIKQAHQLATAPERAAVAKQRFEQRQARLTERKQIAEAKRAKKRTEVTRKIEKRTVKK